MQNIPRWIHSEIQCDWCGAMMPLDTIDIQEVKTSLGMQEVLRAWYQCTELECRCIEDVGRPARFGIDYEGGFPEAWRRHLVKQEKDEKAKPDETVVPVTGEAKAQE